MGRNGFVKKSVGTMTLGEKLKKVRNDRRLGINDVSKITMIPFRYLEYLENGEYDKLPADVYVKGFLRNYAEVLGVDEKIFIRLFKKEKGIDKNLKEKNGEVEEKTKPLNISSFVITPKIIATTVIFLLVLGGIVYLYSEFGSFSNNPRLVILSPEKNYTTSGNSVVVEGVTELDGKIFVNGQPVLVDEDGNFRESLTVQSGTSNINVRAVNKFDKETNETIVIQSTSQEADEGEQSNDGSGAVLGDEAFKIELRVDPGPVWLSVETDGNLVFSGTMLTGVVQSFEANERIVVNSGDGKATLVRFNGEEIGPLSQSNGAAKEIVFTSNMEF